MFGFISVPIKSFVYTSFHVLEYFFRIFRNQATDSHLWKCRLQLLVEEEIVWYSSLKMVQFWPFAMSNDIVNKF